MRNLSCLLFLLCKLSSCAQTDHSNSSGENLKKYAEANSILISMPPDQNRVVFMGNSITEGWENEDPSFFTNKSFINRGISGQTSLQMLLRFQKDVIDLKPAIVVILAGINDIAQNTGPTTLNDILKNIISMAELAKRNKISVILSSVLPANLHKWRSNLPSAEKIIALNKMIKLYADKNNIMFVNYYPAMVDAKKGLDKKFSEDGVHPNLDGYKVMEPLIMKAISTSLKIK